MANFIGLVYATLKNEGVDTSGMSTDEAVAKFKELQKKSGGESGEKGATPAEQRKLEEKGVVDNSNQQDDEFSNKNSLFINLAEKYGLGLNDGITNKLKNDFLSGKYSEKELENRMSNLSIKPGSLRENRNTIKSLMKTVGNKYDNEIEDLIEKDYRLLENVKATINLYPDIYQKAGIKGILRYMDINGEL